MTEQLNIAELRRLHAAATPGDWHYDDGVTDGEGTPDAERGKAAWITANGNVLIAEPSGCDPKEPCVPSLAEMDANGRLIEKSHNALPALLDAAEEGIAERERFNLLSQRCADAEAQRDGFRDGMVAMLLAAGAPSGIDAMEKAVKEAGNKPSDFVKRNFDAIKSERDALRTEIEAAKLILPVCCGSLADAADTLRQERDALKAKVYNLKSRICKMDCRYTMGDTADISGSHCGSPCDRCEAERDYEALRAERDEWKALYQAAVRHAAKKPF